jgi:alpha/beta superfamily hydrolase
MVRGAGRTVGRCSWTGTAEIEDVKRIIDHIGEQAPSIDSLILCVSITNRVISTFLGILIWSNDLAGGGE